MVLDAQALLAGRHQHVRGSQVSVQAQRALLDHRVVGLGHHDQLVQHQAGVVHLGGQGHGDVDHGVDGVVATNTTLARDAVRGLPHADEAGGLSGTPVFEASNRVIGWLRSALGPRFPIVGVGGVDSGETARAKRQAGADLVQIYTGLIYKGPGLVGEVAAALRPARA